MLNEVEEIPISSLIPNDNEEKMCRICRQTNSDEELFFPCKCKGTIKWVHSSCLMKWIDQKKKDPVCEICGTKFKFSKEYTDKKFTPITFFVAIFQYIYSILYIRYSIVVFMWFIVFPICTTVLINFYCFFISNFWVTGLMEKFYQSIIVFDLTIDCFQNLFFFLFFCVIVLSFSGFISYINKKDENLFENVTELILSVKKHSKKCHNKLEEIFNFLEFSFQNNKKNKIKIVLLQLEIVKLCELTGVETEIMDIKIHEKKKKFGMINDIEGFLSEVLCVLKKMEKLSDNIILFFKSTFEMIEINEIKNLDNQLLKLKNLFYEYFEDNDELSNFIVEELKSEILTEKKKPLKSSNEIEDQNGENNENLEVLNQNVDDDLETNDVFGFTGNFFKFICVFVFFIFLLSGFAFVCLEVPKFIGWIFVDFVSLFSEEDNFMGNLAGVIEIKGLNNRFIHFIIGIISFFFIYVFSYVGSYIYEKIYGIDYYTESGIFMIYFFNFMRYFLLMIKFIVVVGLNFFVFPFFIGLFFKFSFYSFIKNNSIKNILFNLDNIQSESYKALNELTSGLPGWLYCVQFGIDCFSIAIMFLSYLSGLITNLRMFIKKERLSFLRDTDDPNYSFFGIIYRSSFFRLIFRSCCVNVVFFILINILIKTSLKISRDILPSYFPLESSFIVGYDVFSFIFILRRVRSLFNKKINLIFYVRKYLEAIAQPLGLTNYLFQSTLNEEMNENNEEEFEDGEIIVEEPKISKFSLFIRMISFLTLIISTLVLIFTFVFTTSLVIGTVFLRHFKEENENKIGVFNFYFGYFILYCLALMLISLKELSHINSFLYIFEIIKKRIIYFLKLFVVGIYFIHVMFLLGVYYTIFLYSSRSIFLQLHMFYLEDFLEHFGDIFALGFVAGIISNFVIYIYPVSSPFYIQIRDELEYLQRNLLTGENYSLLRTTKRLFIPLHFRLCQLIIVPYLGKELVYMYLVFIGVNDNSVLFEMQTSFFRNSLRVFWIVDMIFDLFGAVCNFLKSFYEKLVDFKFLEKKRLVNIDNV